jgi:hypothetical protein
MADRAPDEPAPAEVECGTVFSTAGAAVCGLGGAVAAPFDTNSEPANKAAALRVLRGLHEGFGFPRGRPLSLSVGRPTYTEFISAGPLLPKLGLTAAQVAEQLDWWTELGDVLCGALDMDAANLDAAARCVALLSPSPCLSSV